jgi:hypothetical protein
MFRRETVMDRFVARQNIEHYRDALANETDEGKRLLLLRLIAEEEERLAAANIRYQAQKKAKS